MVYGFKELVTDSRTGLNPRRNFVLGNGDNYYITIKDIYNGKINFSDKTDKVDDAAIQIIKRRSRIKIGDVLFVSIGRIGETAIVAEKDDSWDVNESVFVFSLNMDIIIPEYFCILFQSDAVRQYLIGNSSGSTFKSIKMNQLEKMTFDLPPIEQQRQIAMVLSAIKGLIASRKDQLLALDTLIKARFVELFGEPEANTKNWPVVNMADLCIVGSSKRIYQSEQSMDGVPFWRISDLTNLINTGMATAELFISEERYMMLQAQEQVPVEGDILVTSRGTLGQCYIVRADDKFYFQDGMISWLSEYADGITPLYIAYLFSMPGFRKQIDSMQAGSTVAYLSIAMIRKLKVMLPDMETQNQFSTFVAQVDKSKAVVQAAHVIARNLHSRRQQKCRILNF
jgi:hypothetical protein